MANSKQRQQNGPLEPTQTLGYLNNNPTNLRFSKDNPWEGKLTPKRPGFETFATPEHGIRAAVITLNSHDAQGYRTLAQHIAHWAPPKDQNNVPAYIKRVSKETGFQPDQIINVRDPVQLKSLLKAMTMVELSGNPYSDAVFDAGISAGLKKSKLPKTATNTLPPMAPIAVASPEIVASTKAQELAALDRLLTPVDIYQGTPFSPTQQTVQKVIQNPEYPPQWQSTPVAPTEQEAQTLANIYALNYLDQ